MKVLHIGCGFRPWRINGLIEYAEDLMDTQVAQGYEVGYFFSGRHYPLLRKPSLKKWLRKNISMYEVINSFVALGFEQVTKYPEVDLTEDYSEKFFLIVLAEFQPDIIHIQELYVLPSSLIEIINLKKIPVLMTLHDYFPLCPTSKLFDYNNSLCLQPDIGSKCKNCYSKYLINYQHFIGLTLNYERQRSLVLKKLLIIIYYKLILMYSKLRKVQPLLYFLLPYLFYSIRLNESAKLNFGTADNLDEMFQKRRDINVERLNKIDLLVAQSFRVGEIYHTLGVQDTKIITAHSNPRHLEYIKPKSMTSISFPINIATINGLASIPKGAYLILDTLHKLKKAGLTRHFRLFVMGSVLDDIKYKLLEFDQIVYKGLYDVADLNKLLEEVHVGIVPSVWEEVYGYVGIEFLAKGIPVIGNQLGGIVDYTANNVTGWLNRANTAEGLAQIITDIIRNPNQILHLNQSIISNYSQIIKSMDKHFEEMDKIYRELIQAKQKQEFERIYL